MIEPLILTHLLRDEEFTRKVLPFIKKEYFTTPAHQELFGHIEKFVTQYSVLPTLDAVKFALEQANLPAQAYDDAQEALTAVTAVAKVDSTRRQWLVDQAEQFCKQRALYLAISESINLIDKDFELASSVPDMLRKALGVSFETHIGHSYFDDMKSRHDGYKVQHNRIPFDIDLLNVITKGGLVPKSLAVFVSGTGVGKSLVLCHIAASTIAQGKNVLYITMEMSEEAIAHRIDANLLNVTMDTVEDMPFSIYEKAFADMSKHVKFGRLIIKEYPTSGGTAAHFRSLLDELALKKGFLPDLLIVDYINICAPVRYKMGSVTNSNTYVKAIAEELRGLAVEYNVPVLSATQFNREGMDSSDPGLTNTGDSIGLPQTADLQLALITNEELEQDGRLLIKQLKNRYNDLNKHRRFTVLIDRAKMRISDDTQQPYLANPQGRTAVAAPVTPQTIPNYQVGSGGLVAGSPANTVSPTQQKSKITFW